DPQQRVQRAPDLERAGELHRLQLERHPSPGMLRQPCGFVQWRWLKMLAKALARCQDIERRWNHQPSWRISPRRDENAERARTSSQPAPRAAAITSACT